MTNTQLKAQIDNNITNETAPLGITPSDVGSNIKAVVDYVDQEAALKVNKVTNMSLLLDTEITRLASMTAVFTSALKNTYDAIPASIITKVVKTTISEAQILQLFTTPIAVLLSQTAGIAKVPLAIMCVRNGVGTNYTIATNQFALKTSSGSTLSMTLSNNLLTTAEKVSYTPLSMNLSAQVANGIDNETYSLGCDISNPIGGTGAMNVYVTYIEITL
jgi:hypothetical protein